jgi:hypothetical protein
MDIIFSRQWEKGGFCEKRRVEDACRHPAKGRGLPWRWLVFVPGRGLKESKLINPCKRRRRDEIDEH